MANLEFSMELPAPKEKLFKLLLDFEEFPNYLPHQLNKVKVIERDDNTITTEELFEFKSILTKQISQKTIHKKIDDYILQSQIMTGPAKGSIIELTLDTINSNTHVIVKIDIKLSLKYKLLQPLFKKVYKTMLRGILYKMNTIVINSSNK